MTRSTPPRGASLEELRAEAEYATQRLALYRRKLLLACLMMRRPRVLLMDEPASGLINAEIAELDLLLRKFADEYHLAIVLIEHRLELLGAIADRVCVLDLGSMIAEGAPEQVFKDERVQAAYFGAVA